MEPVICRVCLKENDESFNLFILTLVEDMEIDYATMMMLCASVQVHLEDEYPKQVCSDCFENLKRAFAFKVLCEKSHIRLKEAADSEQDVFEVVFKLEEEGVPSCSYPAFSITDPGNNAAGRLNNNETTAAEPKAKHITIHTCEVCGKIFKQVGAYTRHLAMHGTSTSSKKHFNCTLCGKEFKTLYGLKYHIESHKGIKQYKCRHENCEWSFIAKQALDKHAMTHTDIKTCLCNVCGKAYSTKDSLAHHIKTHSGLRPYKCAHCDKAYMQSSHLNKHVLVVHQKTKLYMCESCGRAYSSNCQLKVHFRKYCGRGVKPVYKFKRGEKVVKRVVKYPMYYPDQIAAE